MNAKVLFLVGVLFLACFAWAISDVQCPTACPSYCAVAVSGTAPAFCSDSPSGFASSHKATAEVKRACFTGETFSVFVMDTDVVYCYQQYLPLGGDGELNQGSSDECDTDGWRPANCP